MDEKPLVDKKYLLEKFPCKMGWKYAGNPRNFAWQKIPY